MARPPKALVPKTSGQGVARYSYQQGYSLGNRGTGGGPLKEAPVVKLDRDLLKLSTAKQRIKAVEAKPSKVAPMNIDYGDTWGKGELK